MFRRLFAKFGLTAAAKPRHAATYRARTETCWMCGRILNTDDPLSGDCGGDCWGCISEGEADVEGIPVDRYRAKVTAQTELLRSSRAARARLLQVRFPFEAEPEMAAFVDAARRYPDQEQYAIHLLEDLLHEGETSLPFLEYCLHALRWPEMQTALIRLRERDKDSPSWRARWDRLLRSLHDDWGDAYLYRAFSGGDSLK